MMPRSICPIPEGERWGCSRGRARRPLVLVCARNELAWLARRARRAWPPQPGTGFQETGRAPEDRAPGSGCCGPAEGRRRAPGFRCWARPPSWCTSSVSRAPRCRAPNWKVSCGERRECSRGRVRRPLVPAARGSFGRAHRCRDEPPSWCKQRVTCARMPRPSWKLSWGERRGCSRGRVRRPLVAAGRGSFGRARRCRGGPPSWCTGSVSRGGRGPSDGVRARESSRVRNARVGDCARAEEAGSEDHPGARRAKAKDGRAG